MSSQSAPFEFAIKVVQQLRSAGFQAVWVGGCVRDMLLQRTPQDYDVATDARPEQIREVFGQRRTLPIGAAFGVITVLGPKSSGHIEVVTFRSDGEYSDGRHPDSVHYSTMQQDALRRDFTINGLFFDPVDEQVYDFVGGQDDLQAGVVRAIGEPEDRFAEDKLRMLRAIRFASTFSFELDLQTANAINNHASEINVVSAERIAAEMRKMLAHRNRDRAVSLLRSTGLQQQILPAEISFESELGHQQTLAIYQNLSDSILQEPEQFVLGLCGLFYPHVNRVEECRVICRHWKLTNEETDRTCWILQNISNIMKADNLPWPKVQRILIQDSAALLLDFAKAVADASDISDAKANALSGIDFCRQRLKWPRVKLDPLALITGYELQQAGLESGPLFKIILEAVRDAQLRGEISEPQQAIQLARQIAAQQR